jgi:hypothetical protein
MDGIAPRQAGSPGVSAELKMGAAGVIRWDDCPIRAPEVEKENAPISRGV